LYIFISDVDQKDNEQDGSEQCDPDSNCDINKAILSDEKLI